MNLMVNLLIDGLRHQFQQVPDPRSGGNTHEHVNRFHRPSRQPDSCQSILHRPYMPLVLTKRVLELLSLPT